MIHVLQEMMIDLPDMDRPGLALTWLHLDQTPGEEMWAQLSPEEQDRADRYKRAADRRRFLVGRWGLRRLLGRYLRQPPQGLVFHYGDRGKPYLAGDPVYFNLSHHGPWIAWAWGDRPVGVDLAQGRAIAVLGLARRFFHPQEVTALVALDPETQADHFWTLWTAKEALLKARGLGLAGGLDWVQVDLGGDRPRYRHPPGWQLYSRLLPEETHLSLAYEGDPQAIAIANPPIIWEN